MSSIGTADRVTIDEWYLSHGSRIERFEAADGVFTTDLRIEQLVAAMAVFARPAPGLTTLPADLHEQLEPALAANWQAA